MFLTENFHLFTAVLCYVYEWNLYASIHLALALTLMKGQVQWEFLLLGNRGKLDLMPLFFYCGEQSTLMSSLSI